MKDKNTVKEKRAFEARNPTRWSRIPYHMEADYTRPLFEITPDSRKKMHRRLCFLYGEEKARQWMPELERILRVHYAHKPQSLIEAEEKGPAKLVLNRINPAMVQRGDMLAAEDVIDLLAIDLLGLVPEDETVLVSSNRGIPAVLDGKSKAGTAFTNIARRLAGEEVPFMEIGPESGFLSRISRIIRSGGD